jgi:hypothetical protein
MEREKVVLGRSEVRKIVTREQTRKYVGYKQLTSWRGKVKCKGRNEVRSTVTREQSDKLRVTHS